MICLIILSTLSTKTTTTESHPLQPQEQKKSISHLAGFKSAEAL